MSILGIVFDAGDTMYGHIDGRWNPRFDFEEVLLRYHPEVSVDRFTEAFDDDDPDLVLAAIHLGYRGVAIDR